jgi:hypothetical protein
LDLPGEEVGDMVDEVEELVDVEEELDDFRERVNFERGDEVVRPEEGWECELPILTDFFVV